MMKRILAAVAVGLMLAAGTTAVSDAHAKTMTVGGSAHAKFGNSL